ncbi:MAG: type II secretion system protein GspL [Woeseia sp.]
MAEFLVIRIGETADELAHWIAVDATGARRSTPVTGPLSAAAAEVQDRTVIVLVPGAEVLTTCVDIPVRGGAKLQAALPYALEEQLAEDIDELHFASGARRSSGNIPVAIVGRERLAGWIEWLTEAGIQPSSMIPENYGLARIPGTISLLVAEGQVMINDGADTELIMQGVSPGDALAAIGALDDSAAGEDPEQGESALPAMPRHVLVYCEPEDEERHQHDWLAIRHEMESVDVNLLPDGVMPRLAVTVATGAGVDLLQGDFGANTEYSGLLNRWRYAAVLLIAFGVVGIAAKATDYVLLKNEEAELKEQFEAEYRQLAPGGATVEDPARLVASLKSRAGTAGTAPLFLQSLEQLSRALHQNADARIEVISYRAGVVDIRLSAPDVSTLDRIQRVVGENGQFQASIQSTDQQGESWSSRMQIRSSAE